MRERGVAALYLFGSYARDEAGPQSDVDVFVDAENDRFFELSNFMGAYSALRQALPELTISYSTRDGLSKTARPMVEQEALRVF